MTAPTDPAWYTEQHRSAWERVKEALRRDWAQTKHDLALGGQELNQDVDDTVKQIAGADPVPPPGIPNIDWDHLEPAVRFGHAARLHYAHHAEWNDDLENHLREDWHHLNGAPSWDRYRPAVKYGWGYRTSA